MVPRPGEGLLEAVERLVEPTRHVGTRRVNKPLRLAAVDCLSENAMQEGILDVQLMHGPPASESQREHRVDGSRFHHWAEGLVVVDFGALSEAPENPTSLVPLKGDISPALVSLDPLAGDDVGARWTRHQIPCLVGKERRVLLFHRAALVRVQQGLADKKRYRGDLRVPRHRCKSLGLQGTSRMSRHHRVNMTRVSVKKWWVVHRCRDMGT